MMCSSNCQVMSVTHGSPCPLQPEQSGGANGITCGTDDVSFVSYPIGNSKVSVKAYNKHTDKDIPIAHVGGVVQTQNGPVIAILNWAAMGEQCRRILSYGQMEYHGCDVNDKSIKVKGGLQHIITADN